MKLIRIQLAGFAALLLSGAAQALPTYDKVRQEYVSSEGVLLDRNGQLLHEMRVDQSGRRLPWVSLAEVSPAFIQTVIRAEDKRFYEHSGVDWLALSDAALDSLFSSKARGASTLSMQVAGMLERSLKRGKNHRTVGQKWDQIKAARELEKQWSKRQILEAYLNLSTFRGEIQGIETAARALFDKHASGLDERESLLLAVLLRGPNAQPVTVAKRACALAQSIQPARPCEGLDGMALQVLSGVPNLRPAAELAPHVARLLVSADARQVVSTLNAELQAFALEAVNRQLATLDTQHVADASVLVVDNASGEVLAYVGNSGASSSARFVDGVRAARQAGSTLKPFLYQLAIEERLLTAASLLDDSPVNLVTPAGLYVPQNYDREFKGLVSVRTALSGSLNVPAVRALTLINPDHFVERLRALGFESIDHDGDYYGYSLALGSAEVSLWQLVQAYRALANGGVMGGLRLSPGGRPATRRVMDRAASFIVSDILADRLARSVTFGLSNPLTPRFWSAVKTGTSKDMRDNWCVGFSTRYTVGVWVGNFDGSAMWDVSGVTGAAPLWLEVMNVLHRGTGNAVPSPPAELERVQVVFDSEIEPLREEYFLSGTTLTHVIPVVAQARRAAIVYPAQGQIIAVDPDIPAPVQRVRFRAAGAEGRRLQWRLNGAVLDGEASELLWSPQPGSFVLSLHDQDGGHLAQVSFQVRGSVASAQQASHIPSTISGED